MTNGIVSITRFPFPLLSGPADIVEGYQELNELERGFVEQALRLHITPTTLWYRALTLFRQSVAGQWDQTDLQHPDFGARVVNLQAQLLGLGISTAKSSLDALLAGYYSSAFAGIRHLLETFVQHFYLVAEPQEYVRWYDQPNASTKDRMTPRCKDMIIKIQGNAALADIGFPADFMNAVYDSWALMSKGSHPTGEGIVQTVDGDVEIRFIYGATYNRRLANTGFDHGLFAIGNLLLALPTIRQQSTEWTDRRQSVRRGISSWREKVAAEMAETDDIADVDH